MTDFPSSVGGNDTPHLTGLRDRVCVITGGAGILGSSICRVLAAAGVRTAILDLDGTKAGRLADELRETTGTPCMGIPVDVLSRESLENALNQTLQAFGPVDFLINGAGGNSPRATTDRETFVPLGAKAGSEEKTFFNLEDSAFGSIFDLNFRGTLLPCQVFGEPMAARGQGVILNISSMNAFRPLTRIPAYSAAKASVNNFTQWLAVHLASAGIRVNAIAPGFFLTEQNRFLLTDRDSGKTTPRGQKILSSTPMGRYGNPGDLGGAVLFLLSEQSSFITGIILPVDGGYSAYGGV